MRSSLKLLLGALILGGVLFVSYQAFTHRKETNAFEVGTIDSLVDYLLQVRQEQTLEVGDVDFGDATEVNVLLLGLDERKEGTEYKDAHCDAIHLFTFDLQDWSIHLTSVPRGTSVYIPGGPYAETDYYLANACAFAGLDYGVSQIEQIIGVRADYVATLGFSQVYGILRLLDLPTTESLQWLRHRHSYQIGEPQRIANQQTFIKDLIINHIDRFESDLTVPLQYVGYSFVDTDMSFSVAHTLLKGYIASNIDERPDAITTELRPYYPTQEIHFDFENYETQLSEIFAFLSPLLSKADLSQMPFDQVQILLVDFLHEQIQSNADLSGIVGKQLWLQIEQDADREALHFAVMEAYALQLIAAGDEEQALQRLTDYVFEKELLGEREWEEKGRELIERILQ